MALALEDGPGSYGAAVHAAAEIELQILQLEQELEVLNHRSARIKGQILTLVKNQEDPEQRNDGQETQ